MFLPRVIFTLPSEVIVLMYYIATSFGVGSFAGVVFSSTVGWVVLLGY
jgi:hypothetical protein